MDGLDYVPINIYLLFLFLLFLNNYEKNRSRTIPFLSDVQR